VLFAQGFRGVCFIELAFHHPQCGWFYRRNVTGIRKKNCGFNFRMSECGFRNISSVSNYRPSGAAIALQMPLWFSLRFFLLRREADLPKKALDFK
jgi:hypothetical protein